MPRTHNTLYYAAIYGLIFLVSSAAFVAVVRLSRDWLNSPNATWMIFAVVAGLAVLLIAPAYYVGRKFIRSERRGIARREGIRLSIAMASMSLVVTFAALSVSETLSANNGRAWIALFTSFQTVPAFTLFWVGYTLVVALPMGGLVWLANRREVKRLDETIDETFS